MLSSWERITRFMYTSKPKNPRDYRGQGICPRCGNGWPVCADGYNHSETCEIYNYSYSYLCGRCSLELALEAKTEGWIDSIE